MYSLYVRVVMMAHIWYFIKKNQRYWDDIENCVFKIPNNNFPSLSTLMSHSVDLMKNLSGSKLN